VSQLVPRTRGANYPAVTDRDVLSVVVPIVEHEVQERVVEQIEAMMAEVEEARALASAIHRDTERLMEAATEEVLGSLGTTKFGVLVPNYKNGIYKPKHYYGRGYPSARMFNIKDGRVDLEKAPLLDVDDEELRAYGLQSGDILVNRVNSRELVGKTGLVPDGLGPCTFESKNIRIRVVHDLADPAFIVAALNSAKVRRQIIERQKPAIGQATINQDDLSALQIPFVEDPKVQSRIVTHLTSVRAEILEMRRLQAQESENLDRLEQAILDRAFRGEL
jgi:type I restriction enzyme S subunit